MAYDEIEYWNNRENPNSTSGIAPKEYVKYISDAVTFSKCLDVGPGVGRMVSAYEEVRSLEVCDVTSRNVDMLDSIYLHRGINFSFMLLDKAGLLPYFAKQFEVVTCTQVLLHQRPTIAVKLMRSMARVGKKVVVISFRNEKNVPLANHCFNHDYIQICEDNNWVVSNVIRHPNHILFTYTEEV